jgi:osmotically-inducible protein OsmY
MKFQFVLAVVSSAFLAVSVAASDTDEALKSNLKQAINQKHVHFDVDKGVVTVKGEVRTEQDRRAIDDMIRGTPGVVALKNKLKVKYPSPGTAIYPSSITPSDPATVSIPIYTTPPPKAPARTVSPPAPLVVPHYPNLKIQAVRETDLPIANKIAQQLQAEPLPPSGLENVTIMVEDGIATVQGFTDTRQTHDALIASLQATRGLSAIYDQLQGR